MNPARFTGAALGYFRGIEQADRGAPWHRRKTVNVHRGRVMEKIQASSGAELVHLCELVGLYPA
jgi:hypothetical protein